MTTVIRSVRRAPLWGYGIAIAICGVGFVVVALFWPSSGPGPRGKPGPVVTVSPQPTKTVLVPTLSPAPGQTLIVITPPRSSSSPRSAHPRPTHTAEPTQRPTPSPTHTRRPTPKPTPTCDLTHLLRCLP